jgi:hypothetical protein
MTIKTSYEFILVDCSTIEDQLEQQHLIDRRDLHLYDDDDSSSSFSSSYSDDSSFFGDQLGDDIDSCYQSRTVDREEIVELLNAYEGLLSLFGDTGVTTDDVIESVMNRLNDTRTRTTSSRQQQLQQYNNDDDDSIVLSRRSRYLSNNIDDGREGYFLRRRLLDDGDIDGLSLADFSTAGDEDEDDHSTFSDDDHEEDGVDEASLWSESVEEYTVPLRSDGADDDDEDHNDDVARSTTRARSYGTKRLLLRSNRNRHQMDAASTPARYL